MKKKNLKKTKAISRFCDKRISSFISNYHKARLTGYITDIHNVRVDMKKIITLLDLFGQFGKKVIKSKKEAQVFDEVFQKSGKIRETQLNIKFLEKFHSGDSGMLEYRHKLEQEEKMYLRGFLTAASGFDERILKGILARIKKLIAEIDIERFSGVAKKFIRRKIEKIRQLQVDMHNKGNAHKIRKHLKSVATVVTVLYIIKPEESAIKYLADLNRTEKMLGAWHDKVVFLESIERFITRSVQNPDQTGISVQQLRSMISEECNTMFDQFSRTCIL